MMLDIELIKIVLPAFCVGIMVALTHAPLGLAVLKRGIIFIDLAIAQIAGLGLLFAMEFIHSDSILIQQITALAFAIAASFAFQYCESVIPDYQEAVIGCCFIVAASLAVLILSNNPHGTEAISHLLSGQILFVSWLDTLYHLPIYIAILFIWFKWPAIKHQLGFYLLFAVAITSSVQLVGVYVVFASLILPALAALQSSKPLVTAWAVGLSAVFIGIVSATLLNLPAGPVLVCSYALISVITALTFTYSHHHKNNRR